MRFRLHKSAISTTVLSAILALAPAEAQTAKSVAKAPKTWTPARMTDGHPDLQGYWTNATFTPLERPAELGIKEFFTEEEAAAFEKQRLLRENSQTADDLHYDNVAWQTENYAKGVSSYRTSLIFDPPDGKIPPLTSNGRKRAVAQAEKARRRNLAEGASDRNLAERCISWGAEGPPMLGTTYNANLQIVQTASSVAIYTEMVHNVRIIPVGGRSHLPSGIRQLDGDSRGHWDGDTLVVDTANFTDETPFRGSPATARQDIYSSENLHVVERFKLIDSNTIQYRFTVDDPAVWEKPWSGEVMIHRFEGPILEYACHEGNYGLANILAGARAAEQKAAK
ncbi:MAG: hypothetical protein JO307_04335 [Bryobacterales bacterium]|nr:hypothetical protein [Bryobacterales bacterium]MBV9398545.1 hypothetical protein [Bryobacterales bacterium]